MRLYHGSYMEINSIDYNLCKNNTDFGRGFYTTNIKEQAIAWAKQMAIEKMGAGYDPAIKAVVTAFDFNTAAFKDTKVKLRRFHGKSASWALFVMNNMHVSDKSEGEHNLDLKYNLVNGQIVSFKDNILFSLYKNGIIDKATLKVMLNREKNDNQYSFHTQASVKYLKPVAHEYFNVDREDFDNYHYKRNDYKLGIYVYKDKKIIHRSFFDIKFQNGMLEIAQLKNVFFQINQLAVSKLMEEAGMAALLKSEQMACIKIFSILGV